MTGQAEDGTGMVQAAAIPLMGTAHGPAGELEGFLAVPPEAKGIVVFAHGSGSGRLSPRNNHVAAGLRAGGLATLLFDLLTPEEAADRSAVFDIPLLASRLAQAARWLKGRDATAGLPLGYFGASTGAAAALVAAALADGAEAPVRAVVSRGGRPDLAGEALERVQAPTLLIVGSLDFQVMELNQDAYARLHCEKHLATVPGARHLFEEPGTLDQVILLARDWFLRHLPET